MPVKADLNIANYDFRSPREAAAFREQNIDRMRRCAATKLQELQAKGIIDKDGNLLRSYIPPGMLPDSGSDVGG